MGKHRKTFGNGRHRRPAAKGPTGLGSVAAGGLPAAALFVAGASAAEAADSQSTSAGDYQSDDSRPSAPDDTQYTDQSGDPTSSAADDSQYTGYQPDQSNNPADSTTDDSQPVAGSGRNDDADPAARRGCRAKNPAHIGSRGTQERPASSPVRLNQALLCRSRGGLTSRIHLAADRKYRPLALVLTARQAADSPQFVPVLQKVCIRLPVGRPRTRPDAVAADKAHSSRASRSYCANAASRQSSRRRRTRPPTGRRRAAEAAAPHATTPISTKNGTPSSA